MPSRLIISMEGTTDDNPFRHMRWLHAIVLAWLEAGSGASELVAGLHDQQGLKPLALMPLLTVSDSLVELRITSLDDGLTDAIRAGIQASGPIITHKAGNRSHSFTVLKDGIDRIDISWNSLITKARPTTSWWVEALTPTVCRGHLGSSKDSIDILLPQPELYFRSWLYRFLSFAPISMPGEEVMDFVRSKVNVSALEGRSKEVPAGKSGKMMAGYVGSACFEVLKPRGADGDTLRALDTLASLAEFSGTGAHTMWGMGVTRISRRGEPVK